MNTLQELIEHVELLEKRVAQLESTKTSATNTPTTHSKELSIREFLNVKQPQSANDRCLAMGYYLEQQKGYSSFNVDDIRASFREAKITLPANLNDVVNKNIAKAFIMDAASLKDGKKAWVLTATGEAVIEKGFAGK